MALLLQPYANRGYSLATSEAGLLPLYSEWRTLDTWGLNDAAIAHRGQLIDEDLERYHPAIVMWHDHSSSVQPPAEDRGGAWVDMAATLQRYVDARGFVLAADFGIQPGDSHYYWVAADIPECRELVAAIRAVPYAWPLGGGKRRTLPPASRSVLANPNGVDVCRVRAGLSLFESRDPFPVVLYTCGVIQDLRGNGLM